MPIRDRQGRRHRLARRRSPRTWHGGRGTRATLRAAPDRGHPRGAVALPVESSSTNTGAMADHRLPLRDLGDRAGGARDGAARESPVAARGTPPEAGRRGGSARQGPPGREGAQSRHPRRGTTAGRTRARARDERRAWQRRSDGDVHADCGNDQTNQRAEQTGARRRDERGGGHPARDPRREPDLTRRPPTPTSRRRWTRSPCECSSDRMSTRQRSSVTGTSPRRTSSRAWSDAR